MKKIDTNYLLDELNLHADMLRALLKLAGFPRQRVELPDPTSPTGFHLQSVGVPVMTARELEHLEGMLTEMNVRRDFRDRTPSVGREARGAFEYSDAEHFDTMLAGMRNLPSVPDMRVILAAHCTALESKRLDIENKLIHTATTRAPETQYAPPTIEEQLKYAPYLPEEVAARWEALVTNIVKEVDGWDTAMLVDRYAAYLQYVLDQYATDPRSSLSWFNTQKSDDMTDVRNDDFWFREAKIVTARGLTGRESIAYKVYLTFVPQMLVDKKMRQGTTNNLDYTYEGSHTETPRADLVGHVRPQVIKTYTVRDPSKTALGYITQPVPDDLYYCEYGGFIGFGKTQLAAQVDLAKLLKDPAISPPIHTERFGPSSRGVPAAPAPTADSDYAALVTEWKGETTFIGKRVRTVIALDGQRLGYVTNFSVKEGWVDVHLPIVMPVRTEHAIAGSVFLRARDGKFRTVRLHGHVDAFEESEDA